MKLKNVKAGVRVEHKGTGNNPERVGALGTILREGRTFPDTPHVQWDNSAFNRSSDSTYGSESIKHLRIVK